MRITLQTEGGFAAFPGLNRPITVESAGLPEPEAAEAARLVQDARFFARPAEVSAPTPGAADFRQYTITVEDNGRRHSVQLVDPIQDPALRALVQFLQRQRPKA